MDRREFIVRTAGASMLTMAGLHALPASPEARKTNKHEFSGEYEQDKLRPLAITMWDFSWLERRWAGAGYEDWDKALSELVERGYDAVRIDAFPHLVAAGAKKIWMIDPHWNNQLWGSPVYTEIQVQPNLNNFIRKCSEYNVKVGLSTWWREDTEQLATRILSGTDLGAVWKRTLESIASDGLLDKIIYVDLSNEYSLGVWTPYLPENTKRNSDLAMRYMHESIDLLEEAFPGIPFCFSITTEYDKWKTEDVSRQDLLEMHIWIANASKFNDEVGYHFQRFGYDDYKNLQLNAKRVYRERESYWLSKLQETIDLAENWSRASNLPLATTECWGPIDYQDMPLLDWEWVKEACAYGTTHAAQTGRWLAIATSNFCGPQFVGMWRDMDWHKALTSVIRSSPVSEELQTSKFARRIVQVNKAMQK